MSGRKRDHHHSRLPPAKIDLRGRPPTRQDAHHLDGLDGAQQWWHDSQPVAHMVQTQKILVTGHIASSLGESLNSLMVVFALALRLNASVGLPWLPIHQLHIPRTDWYKDIGRQGLPLQHVFDMSRLEAILPQGLDELSLSKANGSRVAVLLHRHDSHMLRTRHFLVSRRARGASRIAPSNDEWEQLQVPLLDGPGGFNALDVSLHQLQARYLSASPMVILVRMDAFPEMSCALWGLAPEVRRIISHLELLQPVAPPRSQSLLDDDLTTSKNCGYVFFRGSAAAKIKPTMAGSGTMWINGLNMSGYQTVPWAVTYKILISSAAQMLATTLQTAGIKCVHLDISSTSSSEPLVAALARLGIRSVNWQAPSRYPPVRSPAWLRPRPKPMAENLLRMYYARHSKLFIIERGTCWGDVATMIRTRLQMPTLTMQAVASGELRFDAVPTHPCVRIRGTCIDEALPIPYRHAGGRHPGVC